jgi:hypothetical protein
MRHLLQPRVLNQASIAGLLSALACYPRLSLWLARPGPIWYLEATILVCCIMLWGFVFAWHTPYTNRPVFVLNWELAPFIAATLTGIGSAAIYHLWVDPSLRPKLPEEYPPDLQHWLAAVPFVLALNQLLLIFAPFDWLIRLFKNRWVAASLTALFGACVMMMKIHSLTTPVAPLLLAALLAARIVAVFLAVLFYLRGGVLLVWWWTLLFESRHLLDIFGSH